MDDFKWLTPGLATILAAVFTGLGALLASALGTMRKPSSKAELLREVTEAARVVVSDLRLEVGLLRTRVSDLEQQNSECRGENRQLWQRIDSLEALLRREGIPVTERELPSTFVVLEGERTTVFKPETKKPEGT